LKTAMSTVDVSRSRESTFAMLLLIFARRQWRHWYGYFDWIVRDDRSIVATRAGIAASFYHCIQ